MLLGRADVNPNIADRNGRTPIICAAMAGNEAFVKMLLEREDVDVNTADLSGQTAASWAAQKGHDRIAKLLRDRADFALGYAASLDFYSPEQSGPSEPLSKRIRRF